MPHKKELSSPWCLPLSTARVETDADEVMLGATQLQKMLDKLKEQSSSKLCVNVVDSKYCQPEYIHKLHSSAANNEDLVTIVRAKSNRVVWCKTEEKRSRYAGKRGHELWYGDKFKFKDESSWHKPDKVYNMKQITAKGKSCLVTIESWQNMLLRQKRKIPMNEHPFKLCRVTIKDEEGNKLFAKPMWLMIYGKRKEELNLEEIYKSYLQRYDIEHFFKFDKNHLLSDKFKTMDTQHEENWWKLCSLAYGMLFVARAAGETLYHPWEKYITEKHKVSKQVTASHVQRSFHLLTCQIGTPAKRPNIRGKPLGSKLGEKQIKRKRHPVIIKSKIAEKVVAA